MIAREVMIDAKTVRRMLTRARTAQIEKWAHGAKPTDPAYDIARRVIERMDEIKRLRAFIISPDGRSAHKDIDSLLLASQAEGELLVLIEEAKRSIQYAAARAEAVKARKKRADEKWATFQPKVKVLINNNPRDSAQTLADYLAQEKLTPYSAKSTLRHIETIKAALQKND